MLLLLQQSALVVAAVLTCRIDITDIVALEQAFAAGPDGYVWAGYKLDFV